MPYGKKTYVCFDADSDIHYYWLMQAWHSNVRFDFDFDNAHDLNSIRPSSSEATIKQKLRERLVQSNVLVVLVGAKTRHLYKYVRWEIEVALSMELPIIAVNLNGKRAFDDSRCPAILDNELAVHIEYEPKIMKHALENWPSQNLIQRVRGASGPFYYSDQVYRSL